MSNFKDLVFQPHKAGLGGKHAVHKFDNGYGISVVIGRIFYSNGVDTYEVAGIKPDGDLIGLPDWGDDVQGHLTEEEVSEVMAKFEAMPPIS